MLLQFHELHFRPARRLQTPITSVHKMNIYCANFSDRGRCVIPTTNANNFNRERSFIINSTVVQGPRDTHFTAFRKIQKVYRPTLPCQSHFLNHYPKRDSFLPAKTSLNTSLPSCKYQNISLFLPINTRLTMRLSLDLRRIWKCFL